MSEPRSHKWVLVLALLVLLVAWVAWFFPSRADCMDRGGAWVQSWPMYECVNAKPVKPAEG